MNPSSIFPSLDDFEPTQQTLHAYSQVAGVVARAHAIPHPKWWHISLKVQPDGLVTDNMPLPGGGVFHLKMDLLEHEVVLQTSQGVRQSFSMTAGYTAPELADQVLEALSDLGLQGDYAHEKYEQAEVGEYDPRMARRYLTALANIDYLFKKHRATLPGEPGPVQLWPHGFDLSFEWFGSQTVRSGENGRKQEHPAQLSLGFSPGEPDHPGPYFYSNPWPFEEGKLVHYPLPAGARWFTQGWQGSILPYEELTGDENAEERLLAYARTVFEISAPLLTA